MFPEINLWGIPVDTYILCTYLSFLVVFIIGLALRPKEFPLRKSLWGAVIVIFFAFWGATLLNIVLYAPKYKGQAIVEIVKNAGVAYLGAPVLGLLAFWIFSKYVKWPFLVLADYIAPFFMLDRAIGRLGCLGYGCCYGVYSDLPWAYTFRNRSIAEIVPRHPTQAYMMIYAVAIFVSALYLYRKIKPLPGVFARTHEEASSAGITFFYVWLCYGFLRFLNEFLRAEGPFVYGPIKFSHAVLFIFAIVSSVALFVIIKKSAAKDEILRALKGAVVRLAVWLVVSGVVILSAIRK